MAHRFVIRSLGALPWPRGLGKNAGDTHPYKKLDTQLQNYLGDRRYDPAAHQRAYQSADDRAR
ncbi:hypothetical protein [Mycobacterium intracellulare]|uniref:Uncharacterized protein n=1 Tax=Mycobacterium intracellulare subsp. chimaera TaxID=222805 RepID=A0ABT7P287_MYCIT|nr:hypothetical protein [Mycobacterium intracellulare]MDM3927397.1 hypothetical protein [Mycobacterium intracellulare subsp. chimaera]